MSAIRTVVKSSIVAVAALLAAIFLILLFLNVLPYKYWPNWPIQKCMSSTTTSTPSPGKTMVALSGRTDCYSKGEMESTVWIGSPDDSRRQLVFSAPAHFRDRSGLQQLVVLRVDWKSEDTLEIHYPD